ncbi:hypothetical protein DFAR_860001 [Desulfarculales bacterium]
MGPVRGHGLLLPLVRANFLRESCRDISCFLGKLSYLEVSAAPKRSTLSYANQHKPLVLFRVLFFKAMEHFRTQGFPG